LRINFIKNMKIGAFFEWVFVNQHNHSEFAHFCLFIFLGFLFYTFLLGVREVFPSLIPPAN